MTSKTTKWLALIAFAAIVLRVYAIDRLPPGLFSDEAVEGLDALDVLKGNFHIWFHAGLGREPLFVYLVALSYALFDVSPLTTRLPALIAGLVTVAATFFFAREWALNAFHDDKNRATRFALLASALLAISFWHIQMSRNAHRDILLPLVQAVGYCFLWRAMRTRDWKMFAVAGVVLGLAIYTYSPGRFVGVLLVLFLALEFLIAQFGKPRRAFQWHGISAAAFCAFLVMLPLGIYFAENPLQFVRRFDSASIFNASQPLAAFLASVSGNLAQFIVPNAGYASLHYNLPGKPVFDLFLAPWFLAGIVIAFTRIKDSAHRFFLLWFVVLMIPPFLTSDMIPKGVRGLGTMPGILMFIAISMDALLDWVGARRAVPMLKLASTALIALTFIGSTIWTTYDYFVVWANLRDLPIGFDSDYVETGEFVRRLPTNQPAYVSAEVYRHPAFMLLGKHVPTSQYFDRSTRVKEVDATTSLVSGDANAITVFVRDQSPPEDWYRRLAPRNEQIATGKFFAAYRLRDFALPKNAQTGLPNALLTLVGHSRFSDDPPGIALYWKIVALPDDRTDMNVRVTLLDARARLITQKEHRFGYPPMEWGVGETVVEWYDFDLSDQATQFQVELSRGNMNWQSPMILLK